MKFLLPLLAVLFFSVSAHAQYVPQKCDLTFGHYVLHPDDGSPDTTLEYIGPCAWGIWWFPDWQPEGLYFGRFLEGEFCSEYVPAPLIDLDNNGEADYPFTYYTYKLEFYDNDGDGFVDAYELYKETHIDNDEDGAADEHHKESMGGGTVHLMY